MRSLWLPLLVLLTLSNSGCGDLSNTPFRPSLGQGTNLAQTKTYEQCLVFDHTQHKPVALKKRIQSVSTLVADYPQLATIMNTSGVELGKKFWQSKRFGEAPLANVTLSPEVFSWVTFEQYVDTYQALLTLDVNQTPQFLAGEQLKLTDKAQKMLQDGNSSMQAFFDTCGTHFVAEQAYGGEYAVLLQIDANYKSAQEILAQMHSSSETSQHTYGRDLVQNMEDLFGLQLSEATMMPLSPSSQRVAELAMPAMTSLSQVINEAHAVKSLQRYVYTKGVDVSDLPKTINDTDYFGNLSKKMLFLIDHLGDKVHPKLIRRGLLRYEQFFAKEFIAARQLKNDHRQYEDTFRIQALQHMFYTYQRNYAGAQRLSRWLKQIPAEQVKEAESILLELKNQNTVIESRAKQCLGGDNQACDTMGLNNLLPADLLR